MCWGIGRGCWGLEQGALDKRMPRVSGRCRQPLLSKCPRWMLCKGRQAGSRGQGSLPSELVPGRGRGLEGASWPAPTGLQERGRGRLPQRVLLAGWAAVCQDHQVRPAKACGGRDESPGPQDGQEGGTSGVARPFCSSHAGWWSWHFQPGCPVPQPVWVASG